jgi:hypothetical protein
MIFTRKNIRESAGGILQTFDEHNITSLRELERNIGNRFYPGNEKSKFVEISSRPLRGIVAPAISIAYVINTEVGGTPVEARVDRSLGRYHIVCKLDEVLPDYTLLTTDSYGNEMQSKALMNKDFSDFVHELGLLSRL